MSNFVIKGGKKLHGEITTNTSKNAALACMYASLISKEPSTLIDVPRIEEVERTREILTSIGAKAEWTAEHTLKITPARRLTTEKINVHAFQKTRAGLLLMGTLVHERTRFSLPREGGCKLGERSIFPHRFIFERFGFQVHTKSSQYEIQKPRIPPARKREIIMYESGDTTTENAIFIAVLTPGITVIKFASANYMVQDVCCALNRMGAKISGIGTTTLIIEGVKKLSGAKNYPIMPDPIESMILLSIAATTNSEITIKNCPKDFISLELTILEVMHFNSKILRKYKSKNGSFDLVDIQTLSSTLVAPPEKIHPRPYPGLNIDNLPYFVPIATQAKGKTLIHDWVFENRALYYMEFQKLGADILLADPHRVYITGKTALSPAEVICPPALRPASILLVGMLSAKGKSILRNTYSIDRGYENLYNRLKTLGADIEMIP